MVKKQAHFFVLMILLAALPAAGQAQDLNTVINNVTKAMGSANLKTIRYSGTGSSFTGGKDAVWVKSYTRDIDLGGPTSRVQIVREQGTPPVEAKENQNVGTDAAWSKQFELWTNPWAFLKGAAANNATVSSQTVFAQKVTVLTFTVQGKYKVSGFINDKNMIEKIQAWIDPNETLVETIYRDYQDFNGVKFPTMIIENQAGELAMIVVVNDVKANAGIN
jgi:hypothetical protein